jgi:predicted NBD/HSP70 family sugar kinase/biotin operon repressor
MSSGSALAGAWRLPASHLTRGTNQIGVRLYNERLVLSLVRRYGALSKADIARKTGLSAQTISVIIKQLESDGLLIKQSPQRGRIGQPSVPFAINPDGAFNFGLKIGRRSSELILVDFLGKVLADSQRSYGYPTPAETLDFVVQAVAEITAGLGSKMRERIAGLGIAVPYELWSWEEETGAPREILEEWRTFDIEAEIAAVCPWPVHLCNDATAACAAELSFGKGHRYHDFLYFFIGSFVGGGVVLNGNLYPGRSGNAGALGPMLIAGAKNGDEPRQLIQGASLYILENKIKAEGREPDILWQSPDDWSDLGAVLDDWIDEVARNLAMAIVSAISVIDFEAVLIDGAVPANVRARIVERTIAAMGSLDRQGLSPVEVAEGSIGSGAQAIGSASLPLLANFARDHEVLFKDTH